MSATFEAIVAEDVERILAHRAPWADLDGATVWVSGAAGFVPAYLIETLLRRNERLPPGARCTVLGLVRSMETAQRRFERYAGRDDLMLAHWDAALPLPASAHEWPAPTFVIHAASQASPRYFGKDPVGTFLPNVMGTHHLLEVARRAAARGVLFFSSSEVYGQVPPEQIPTAEGQGGFVDPATVRACYAESKRAGETLCVAYASQFGVRTTMARLFHTYGPGLRLDDGRVFADFIRDALDGRDITLLSDGSARRPYCYLTDAARGLFTILLTGVAATPYNVGNDTAEVSVLELARLIAALSPKRPSVTAQPRVEGAGYLASTVARNCPDTSRLRALGWSPDIDVQTGFDRTLRSFQ
ncbi:MAG: NAD-dependent epimerase/dehydratase family protein [Myxococcaceae bacterium]|nr:NAD-dependent epimerase/dehydratase family protein [Myxococcaceae bacterium]